MRRVEFLTHETKAEIDGISLTMMKLPGAEDRLIRIEIAGAKLEFEVIDAHSARRVLEAFRSGAGALLRSLP